MVLPESISVSKEDLHISGMTLMIIFLFHMGSYQPNCLGEFLPVWMIRILQLTDLGSEIKFPNCAWQLQGSASKP